MCSHTLCIAVLSIVKSLLTIARTETDSGHSPTESIHAVKCWASSSALASPTRMVWPRRASIVIETICYSVAVTHRASTAAAEPNDSHSSSISWNSPASQACSTLGQSGEFAFSLLCHSSNFTFILLKINFDLSLSLFSFTCLCTAACPRTNRIFKPQFKRKLIA